MTINQLIQRRGLEKKVFEIKENGVKVTTKKLLDMHSYFVPFENIGTESQEMTHLAPGIIGAFKLAGFFAAFLLLAAACAGGVPEENMLAYFLYLSTPLILAFILLFTMRKQELIYGFNGSLITFYRNSPNRGQFKTFVNRMQEKKKEYLRVRYLALANANDFLDVQTLHWLRTLGALKQEEIDVMMERRIF